MTKFERDLATFTEIMNKGAANITHEDRMTLLHIYQIAFHDSGKIEDLFSCDSSCHGCEFCQKMQEAAEHNPLHICGYCYDKAQEARWVNVKNRHGLNMAIMASVEFTEEELATLYIAGICRINSSGDTPNSIYANNMRKIAITHPFVRFALWAKNVLPVEQVFDLYGKPENLIFIQSSILIGIPGKMSKWADYLFTVYPDEETLQAALKAGAVECNGKKCKVCGFACYLGKWPKGANVAEVLRVPAKVREKVIAAYREYIAKLAA